jgi:hypothetical protein
MGNVGRPPKQILTVKVRSSDWRKLTDREVSAVDLLELLVNLRNELSDRTYKSKRAEIVETAQRLLIDRGMNRHDEIEQDYRDPADDKTELKLQVSIDQMAKLTALQRLLDRDFIDIIADIVDHFRIQADLSPLICRYKLYDARKQVRRPSKNTPAFRQLNNDLSDAADLISSDQQLRRSLLPKYKYKRFLDTPKRPPASHK